MRLSAEFARTRFDALAAAIEEGDVGEVRRLSAAAREEYVRVHDGLRDAVGAILSYAVDVTSAAEGEAIGRRVIDRVMTGGGVPQYGQADLRARVRAIAAGWHWHVTEFTVVEDDEKITFRLAPCGSGMRLEREGRYDGSRGWHRSAEPSPSTFLQRGFPMYSNHCAEMTRSGLAAGSAAFLVEGWTPERGRGVCFQHTFKRLDAVPAEFYRRVGLERPELFASAEASGRLFTDVELEELATHPLDRAAAATNAGQSDAALAALAECREAWGTAMYAAYRRWIALLWEEVCAVCGEREREPLLVATAPELLGHVRRGDARTWASFWSMHLGLRSIEEMPGGSVAFELDAWALLDSEHSRVTPELFCRAIECGTQARGWSGVGRLEARGDRIRHTLDGVELG